MAERDRFALPDSMTVVQRGTVPVVSQVAAWAWRCGECGWLGTGLYSESAAIKEAAQHAWDDHELALCAPEQYGHPGHAWEHVKGTDAISRCSRCEWMIGK